MNPDPVNTEILFEDPNIVWARCPHCRESYVQVNSAPVCSECWSLFPPALIKALNDDFDAALGLRDGTIVRFRRCSVEGEWIHLVTCTGDFMGANGYVSPQPIEQVKNHCPYPFYRGIDVRLSDIVWAADAPLGS